MVVVDQTYQSFAVGGEARLALGPEGERVFPQRLVALSVPQSQRPISTARRDPSAVGGHRQSHRFGSVCDHRIFQFSHGDRP